MTVKKASSVAEFKKLYADGQLVKLPKSGMIVRMRSVSLGLLLKRGRIPDPLMGAVLKALALFPDEGTSEPQKPPDAKTQALAYVELMDDVVRESLIEPPVKGGPQPDADKGIDVDWLEDEDKFYIYMILNVPLSDLAQQSFRDLDAESMELVQSGETDV